MYNMLPTTLHMYESCLPQQHMWSTIFLNHVPVRGLGGMLTVGWAGWAGVEQIDPVN